MDNVTPLRDDLPELPPQPTTEEQKDWDDARAWLEYGVAKGWCSDSVCATHAGLPNTPEEEQEWEEGHDPCIPGVRLW